MPDVLSQSEVDALLNEVDSGVDIVEIRSEQKRRPDFVDVLLDLMIDRFIERYGKKGAKI